MKARQLADRLVIISILASCGSASASTSTSAATAIVPSQPAPTEAPSDSPAVSAVEVALVAESANPDGGVTCTVEGLAFTAPLASCDAAIAIGTPIVVELGLANASPAVELTIASTCYIIQGREEKTGEAATVELARRLNAEEVCPGDPDLIVP